MLKESIHKKMDNSFSGIEVSIKELIDLRREASHQSIADAKNPFSLSGLRLTSHRGRGIEFDSTREYQAGDDIRSMAWRVTARSLKPHVKIYHEEKEHPVWLAVDLSPSLYFGTRCMFKSVCSIKQAVLLGWQYLLKHERIGSIIAAEHKMLVYKPHSSERDFLAILTSLSECSELRPAFNENNYLHSLLSLLQQQVRTGNLVFITSDFSQFNDEHKKLIAHIAQRAQVVLIFVYDPIEAEAPPPHPYVVTNDEQKIVFNMSNPQARQDYQQQFQDKKNNLIAFARTHNLTLQLIRTDQKKEE